MPRKKNQVKITCEHCNKEFSIKASLAKNRRFCSWDCKKAVDSKKKIVTECENCGKELQTYKNNKQKYCSYSCAMTARNLTEQNPSYHRNISGENNPMYGKGNFGEANGMYGKTGKLNPAWNGGRKQRKDGYVFVYSPTHPHASGNYVLEHRLVMEKEIGRYLEPNEVVHHIDENPSNNNPDNLRLYSSQSEHIKDAHS